MKKWDKEHPEKIKESHLRWLRSPKGKIYTRQTLLRRRGRNNKFVFRYLSTHPCVDCKEKDIRCLDFDHVKGKKLYDISYMRGRGLSIDSIKNEIDKCEVRCSNCHRKRHFDSSWIGLDYAHLNRVCNSHARN